jgi:hypothetical protein
MTELAKAILLMVTVWITPSGDHIYAPHFRSAPEGPQNRALDLAADFTFAEKVTGVDRYLLAALAFRESAFDANAIGEQNEFTIMQLHPRSKVGRSTAEFCKLGIQCERVAVLAAAQILAIGIKQCGNEASTLGFYRTGHCIAGPGAKRVLEVRALMLELNQPPALEATLQ